MQAGVIFRQLQTYFGCLFAPLTKYKIPMQHIYTID